MKACHFIYTQEFHGGELLEAAGEILLGGGNIHCITQLQPAARGP